MIKEILDDECRAGNSQTAADPWLRSLVTGSRTKAIPQTLHSTFDTVHPMVRVRRPVAMMLTTKVETLPIHPTSKTNLDAWQMIGQVMSAGRNYLDNRRQLLLQLLRNSTIEEGREYVWSVMKDEDVNSSGKHLDGNGDGRGGGSVQPTTRRAVTDSTYYPEDEGRYGNPTNITTSSGNYTTSPICYQPPENEPLFSSKSDKQTDRQSGHQTQTGIQIQPEGQIIDRQSDRQTGIESDRQPNRQSGQQTRTGRQTQLERQTDIESDNWTDRQSLSGLMDGLLDRTVEWTLPLTMSALKWMTETDRRPLSGLMDKPLDKWTLPLTMSSLEWMNDSEKWTMPWTMSAPKWMDETNRQSL